MIELHYAKIDLDEDIPCYLIETRMQLKIDFLFAGGRFNKSSNVVYLASVNENVFVSHDFNVIYNCIHNFLPSGISLFAEEILSNVEREALNYTVKLYIQEYPSYEEAYIVALDMMESNELCYSIGTKDSAYWEVNLSDKFIDNL